MPTNEDLQQQLKLAQYKLKALLGITLAINKNMPAHDLLEKYRDILCEGLNVGTLVVFTIQDNLWNKVLSYGVSEEFGNNADEVSSALLSFVTITQVTDRTDSFFADFDIIIPVYHKSRPLAYVLLGKVKGNEELFGKSSVFNHLNTIRALSNIVVSALENKRLYKKSLEQEILKKELEVASRMQAMLIPSVDALPNNDFLRVNVFYKPHQMVGGDYYDFLKLNDYEYGFCIADVSGKGIPAAILMANFQANIRILFKRSVSLKHLVNELNENVNENVRGDSFVTFFIAKYNAQNKILHYVNAGHNPPLLYDSRTKTVSELTLGCVGLGMLDDIPQITMGTVEISSGDKLICFTDGLVEGMNEQGVQFGTEPIVTALKENESASSAVDCLSKTLHDYTNGKFSDDVSIFGIDFL